jgi:hypothetical protein
VCVRGAAVVGFSRPEEEDQHRMVRLAAQIEDGMCTFE